ncbi:hypothetical protein MTO96_051943 [Rhipicephalus appendiculatus]
MTTTRAPGSNSHLDRFARAVVHASNLNTDVEAAAVIPLRATVPGRCEVRRTPTSRHEHTPPRKSVLFGQARPFTGPTAEKQVADDRGSNLPRTNQPSSLGIAERTKAHPAFDVGH